MEFRAGVGACQYPQNRPCVYGQSKAMLRNSWVKPHR